MSGMEKELHRPRFLFRQYGTPIQDTSSASVSKVQPSSPTGTETLFIDTTKIEVEVAGEPSSKDHRLNSFARG